MDSHYNEQQTVIDEARPKIGTINFPKHRPYIFKEAFTSNLVDKVYEEGEEVGFLIKGN
jgi:hypothetical protein